MTIINRTRFKPALYALLASSFVVAAGCSSSGTDVQAAGSAASQVEAATKGSISGDCVSGSGGGASATVCADENGNASVKATVDDGSSASIDAAGEDTDATVDESADDTAADNAAADSAAADDEDTDTSAASGAGSATTTKAAASGKCGAGFPLPSGTTVLTCSDSGTSVDLLASVPDAEKAYDFYLDALPGAGYKIGSKDAADVAGVYGANINFTGGDYKGKETSVVISDLGSATLTIHLQR